MCPDEQWKISKIDACILELKQTLFKCLDDDPGELRFSLSGIPMEKKKCDKYN